MSTDAYSSAIAIVPEPHAIVRARLPRVRIEVACSARKFVNSNNSSARTSTIRLAHSGRVGRSYGRCQSGAGDEKRISAVLFQNDFAPATRGIYFLETSASSESSVRLQFF